MSKVKIISGNLCDTSDLLKTLSNESRLGIICLLCQKGQLSVNEISNVLQLEQSATSHQLAKLRSEKIISGTRSGQTIKYQLADNAKSKLTQQIIDSCGCLTG